MSLLLIKFILFDAPEIWFVISKYRYIDGANRYNDKTRRVELNRKERYFLPSVYSTIQL